MGILKALFTTKVRTIKEYRFLEIAEDTISPYIAQKIKEILDCTNFFDWDTDSFNWHTFDGPAGGKSSVSFNAKFVKNDESNNRVYIDTGKTDTGEDMFFYFTIAPSNEALYICVKGDNNSPYLVVLVLLKKK